MTPEELEKFRLNARITALEAMLVAVISAAVQSEAARREQARQLDLWLKSLEEMRFPEISPEYSDLFSAEFQEAAASLVSFIKLRLKTPRHQ